MFRLPGRQARFDGRLVWVFVIAGFLFHFFVSKEQPPARICGAFTREAGSTEGLFVAPEGAACFVALKSLRATGKIEPGERVVIFDTGSGIKYLDCYDS